MLGKKNFNFKTLRDRWKNTSTKAKTSGVLFMFHDCLLHWTITNVGVEFFMVNALVNEVPRLLTTFHRWRSCGWQLVIPPVRMVEIGDSSSSVHYLFEPPGAQWSGDTDLDWIELVFPLLCLFHSYIPTVMSVRPDGMPSKFFFFVKFNCKWRHSLKWGNIV